MLKESPGTGKKRNRYLTATDQRSINEIYEALICRDRLPYEQLRERLIKEHGYIPFRLLQAEAFFMLYGGQDYG